MLVRTISSLIDYRLVSTYFNTILKLVLAGSLSHQPEFLKDTLKSAQDSRVIGPTTKMEVQHIFPLWQIFFQFMNTELGLTRSV